MEMALAHKLSEVLVERSYQRGRDGYWTGAALFMEQSWAGYL